MKFHITLFALLLSVLIGTVAQSAVAQQPIQITTANQHLFLIIKGSLGLACHRPVGAPATLYGEIETVRNPNGTTQRLFVNRGRTYVQRLQRRYNDQIKALKTRYQRERNRRAARAILNQIKAKLKLRQAAFKQARSALNGCRAFTPGTPPEVPPPPPPADESDNTDEEYTFEDSPFPLRQSNVDGTVKLDPAEDSIVFYVSYRGNDAENGLSPEAAVRTYARAWSLVLQSSPSGASPHQIRFERGGTYNDLLTFINGWSSEVPFVIGDYGPTNLPRPIMTRPVVMNGAFKNIAITGLDFYNPARDPFSTSFNPSAPDVAAIRITGAVSRVLVQLSNFRSYTSGITVTGAGSTGPQFARRIASIRNNFIDLYAKNGQLGGASNGIAASNVKGLNITGCLFARHGNPLGLSSEQGNTGATGLPVIVPNLNAIAVNVGGIADSYVVLRDNQFIQGYTGIKVDGYTLDRFGQLAGTLGTLEIYDNLFYENTYGVALDTPAVMIRNNAFVRGSRRGAGPFVAAMMVKNASAIDIYNNVVMNSLSDLQGKDRGIYVYGHADFAYHKVFANKLYNWPGGFIIGQLTWYDSIWVDGPFGPRQVPLNRGPESIVYRDNYIVNSDTHQPLIEVAQWDRGTSTIVFRNNTLWNPNLPNGNLWSGDEYGRVSAVEHVYEDVPSDCGLTCLLWPNSPTCTACQNPQCLYTILTRTPNLRMSQPNWYAAVGGASIHIDPSSLNPIIGSSANTVTLECTNDYAVGDNHYVHVSLNQSQWYEYINAGGGVVNELPPSDPEGLKVEPVTFADPERTLLTFLAANNVRVRGSNGLMPAMSVEEYIDYVANFWRHTPNEELSLDPRTWGKNVAQYFRAGLNVVTP